MSPQITSQQIHEYLKATNWIVERFPRSWYANYCHWKIHRRWLRYVGWHKEEEKAREWAADLRKKNDEYLD